MHHPILYTGILKTNSYINQSKLCLLQSHSSSNSTWQHHSLVSQLEACQTLNELVQRDTQMENKSHFCRLCLQRDCFIQFSHCCSLQLVVQPWLKQMGVRERRLEQDCNDLVLFQFKSSRDCTLRHKGLYPRVIHRPPPSMSGPERLRELPNSG